MAEQDEPIPGSAAAHSPARKPPQRVELRWLHYLIEFLIVAMGISVPFLLDRWNQNIQERRDEQQVLLNLERELEEDLANLRNIMSQNSMMLDQFRSGDRLIRNNDREQLDTLVRIARNMSDISDFHRSSTVYQTLVNSGDVQLVRNRKILRDLQNLEELFIYMNRLENNHLSVFIDQILPELMHHMQLAPPEPLDRDWFYSYQLSNLLQLSIFLCEEKRGLYSRIEHILLELQQLLQTELKES